LSRSHWSQKDVLDLWDDSGNCNKPIFLFAENMKHGYCQVIQKEGEEGEGSRGQEGDDVEVRRRRRRSGVDLGGMD